MINLPATVPPKEILFKPFPKQQEFLDAAFSGKYSFILYGGAIRGGKTYAMLAFFILLCKIFPGSRWAIVRKDLPTIKRNILPTWEKIKPTNFIESEHQNPHEVHFKNGSRIIFFPETYKTDKDQDRWKGFEVNGFGFEEINECQEISLNKAFERAGSYIIKGIPIQPKPIIVATCNPTQGWVKDRVYSPSKEKTLRENWLYIQSRIYDNIPLLEQQPDYLPSLKANMNRFELEVFVEGNWDVQLKTGGEFLRNFELDKHVKSCAFESDTVIGISLDSNVYPHIAITVWQAIRKNNGWVLKQIGELPASDPENTASRAARKIVNYLQEIDYNLKVVYLHGDRSTKARNNIDDNKRSFFQIINEHLISAGFRVVDKMRPGAPAVANVGAFVNAILAYEIPNLEIEIDESCKASINDYIETKTDKDGTILKVRVPHPTIEGLTFEKNGHLTDTLKDFVVQTCWDEFINYTNRHKKLIPGGISTVNRQSNITL